MHKLPISVFIIAKNEADRIHTTIASVKGWADEIIVIDSGSTDDTVKVSESLDARVFFKNWEGYGLQKRFGEDQCKNTWLLNLDADEEVSTALAQEIKNLFASGTPPCSAYVLRVRDLLPGETKLAPFAHTNRCIRLYTKERARFSKSPVHDSVLVAGGDPIGELKNPVFHRSFRSLAHAIEKMNGYTSAQALNLAEKGLAFAHLRLLTEFPVNFLKAYLVRMYILRGWRGFTYSIFHGFARTVRIAKYLEKRG